MRGRAFRTFALVALACSHLHCTLDPKAQELPRATRDGEQEKVRALLDEGGKVNARAPDSATALHEAAMQGRADLAKLLIANGADVNAPDNHGFTPLDATNYDPDSGKEAKRKIADLLRSKGGKHRTQSRKEPSGH